MHSRDLYHADDARRVKEIIPLLEQMPREVSDLKHDNEEEELILDDGPSWLSSNRNRKGNRSGTPIGDGMHEKMAMKLDVSPDQVRSNFGKRARSHFVKWCAGAEPW
jgi:hypothetical protein